MCDIVVRIMSMRVPVLWVGSYRVGVVIVVWRLFSRRNRVKSFSGVRRRRSMLISPWMVIVVLGCFVRMVSIASCKSLTRVV